MRVAVTRVLESWTMSEQQPSHRTGMNLAIGIAVALLCVAVFFLFHELRTPHHL